MTEFKEGKERKIRNHATTTSDREGGGALKDADGGGAPTSDREREEAR